MTKSILGKWYYVGKEILIVVQLFQQFVDRKTSHLSYDYGSSKGGAANIESRNLAKEAKVLILHSLQFHCLVS